MLSAAHPLVQSLSWLVEIPIHLNHLKHNNTIFVYLTSVCTGNQCVAKRIRV
jgi:hypothetical protein